MYIVRFMPEVPLTRLRVHGKMFRTVGAGKAALLVGRLMSPSPLELTLCSLIEGKEDSQY